MTFFEDYPQRPEHPPHTPPTSPAWAGPPADELPGVVPVSAFVHSGERVALALKSVDVYSTGCVLDLVWTVRRAGRTEHEWRDVLDKALTPRGPFQPGSDGLLVGVGFGDGRKAFAAATGPGPDDRADDVAGPVLIALGAGGAGGNDQIVEGTSRYWLWPLPIDGKPVLVAKWDGLGLPESSLSVPVESFPEAARSVRKFWVE